MKNVSIIILNWNNWGDTITCLDSLKNLDYPNYEIVVVDNGSTDESVHELRQTLDPPKGVRPPRKTTFTINKKNLGFSGGNNVGIKYALDNGADYILLLNNDTVVEPSFLKTLIGMSENPNSRFPVPNSFGILGPRINYFESKDLVWFNGGEFGWPLKYNYHLDFRKKESELKNLEPREVDFITGACMLVKRAVFEKIGLLDERFFLYFEDMDFCLRAKKAGFASMIVPQAKIYHKVSATASKLQDPIIWYYHVRNYLLLVKKNKGMWLNFTTWVWARWIYGKQVVKQILFPGKRGETQIIRRAITDSYRGNFGKYR